jgi:hypothetical protein
MPNTIDPITGLQEHIFTDENNERTYDPILGPSYSYYPTEETGNQLGSKYDESIQPFVDLEKTRGDRQSTFAQFSSAIQQAAVGEVLGGTIEGLGYLLDVEQYSNLAKGTEQEFGNWFSDLGKGLRTWSEEATPIYKTYEDGEFAPNKASWWMSNIPSVASTLSLIIPSAGVVRGLSLLGKATKIGEEMGLATRWAAKGLTQAVVSRHMENMMAASGTFNELYEDGISKGMSKEDATKLAANGAANTYQMDWVMLAQDLPQYLLLNRSFSKASLDNTIATARAMGKSVAPVFGKKGAAITWDMLTEGGEEAYQYIVGEEAKYQAQKAFDPSIESSFSDRLSNYTKNGELWTSAFFGALGAGVTQTAGKAINKLTQGIKDPRVEDIQSWGSQFSYWNQRLKEAQESEDGLSERYIKDNLWSTIGTKAASVGNTRNAMDFLEAMQKPTQEDLETFGVNEDDLKVFKSEIPKGVEQLKRIGELYNFNSRKYEPNRAALVTQLQSQLENGVKHREELSNRVNQKRQQLNYLDDLYKTPFISEYVTNKTELINLKKSIKLFEKLSTKDNIPEREKIAYTDALNRSKKELEVVTTKVKELRSAFDSKIEKGDTQEIKDTKKAKQEILEQIDKITAPALDEYMSTKQQLDLFDNHIKSLQNSLFDIENGKSISTEKERANYEEQKATEKAEAKEYLPTIDDLVQDDQGTYKVTSENDEDDTIELHLLDEKGEMISGAATKVVPRSSVDLYAKKGDKEAPDSIEPINDIDIPTNIRNIDYEPKRGLKSVVEAITYRGANYNEQLGKFITDTRNQELDNYVSNPSNKLEGDEVSMFIDTKTTFSRFWNINKVIKYKLDKGEFLTPDEANKLLNSLHLVAGKEVFDQVVDKMPIGIVYKTNEGKEFKDGIYYHDTDYVDKHLIVPSKEKDPIAYKNKERELVRDTRKKILYSLLTGNNVVMSNIKRTQGVPNNTKNINNIATILKQDPNKVEIGIVDSTNKAWVSDGNYLSSGKLPYMGYSGNIMFTTDKTCDGTKGAIKANIAKLTPEHAAILWDAIYLKNKKGSGGNQAQFIRDDIKNLTVGEAINLLALYGPITNLSHPSNAEKNMQHLENKQLYVEKGFLHFGTNVINLSGLYKGLGDINKDRTRFIEWATNNKNYSVSKKPFGKIGPTINSPINREYKLGSWEATKNDTQAGILIKHMALTTDVEEFENTGSLYHAPVVIIDPKSLKSIPGSTTKKTQAKATTQVNTIQAKESSKPTTKVKPNLNGLTIIKDKNTDLDTDIIANLSDESVIYNITNTSYEVKSGVYETETKQDKLFEIQNGKFVLYSKSLRDTLGLDIKGESEEVEMSDTNITRINRFLSRQVNVQVDTKNTKENIIEEVKELPKVESNEVIKPEDYDPTLTFENKGGFGSALADMLVPSTTPVKYTKWNQKKELGWLSDKLGDVPVEVIDGLIYIAKGNKKAFGQLQRDSILLSNVALQGTTYHEAFHRVSMLYLEESARQSMYNEARIKYKLKDSTDRKVEEFLAEEFRNYVITQEQLGVVGKVAKFFKELYQLVKLIFTGTNSLEQSDIDKLFNNIQKGKFKYNKVLSDNLKKWIDNPNLEYRDIQLDQIDSYKHFKQIIKGLSAELLSGVRSKLFKEATSKYEVIGVIDSVEQINFDKLKSDIQTGQIGHYTKLAKNRLYELDMITKGQISPELASLLKDRYKVSDMNQIKENLSQEASNATKIKDLYKEVIDHYDDIYKPAITDYIYSELSIKKLNDESQDEEVGNEIVKYDKSSYEFSAKDNMQSSIKFLVSNLKLSDTRNTVTGLVEIAPMGEVWSKLLTNLSHLDTVEDMIKVLDIIGDTNAYQPYKDLSKYLKMSSELTRTQFQTTMKQHRHNFINTIVEVTDNDGQLNYEFRFMDADLHSASRMLLKEWTENFIKSDFFSQDKFNDKLFKKLQSDYDSAVKELREDIKGSIELDQTTYNDHLNRFTELFNRLGININKETLALGSTDIIEIGRASNKEEALYLLMSADLSYLFSKDSSLQKLVKGDITDNKKVLSNEKIVDKLAELYAIVNPMDLSDTVLGPEGNKHYKYSLPTYVTDIVKKLREDADFKEKLLKDPFNRGSYILNSDTSNLSIGTFNTILINNTGDDGRDYLAMSPTEDFLYKLSATRAGYFMLPTLADRKTYPPIKGVELPEIKYEIGPNGPVLPEWVLDIYFNYTKAERDRITTAQQFIEDSKVSDEKYKSLSDIQKNRLSLYQEGGKEKYIDIEKLVENYHYKTSGKYVIIDAKESISKPNALRHILFPSLEGLTEDKWRSKIREDLANRIDNTFDEAKDLNIITNNQNILLNKVTVDKLTNDFNGDTKLALSSMIADFEIKTQIASIETMMLFMGDVAFYKSDKESGSPFEEYVKRLSVVTSSGGLLRGEVPGEFENTQYNVTTLYDQELTSAWYDILYKKQEEILNKKYTDKEYVKKLLTNLLRDYKGKINPTDAQVFISPEMHREIAIRKGEWSDKKQIAYELLQSDEKLTPEQEQDSLNVVMQPLKYVYFDRLSEDTSSTDSLMIPTYDKMSMATLFRRFTKGTQLDELLDRMEGVGRYQGSDKIHMVKFESAVKVGKRRRINLLENTEGGKLDIIKPTRISDLSNASTYKQNFEYLRHQVVTDPHDTEDTLFGSQVKKVPQGNVLQDADYTINGELVKGKDVLNAINKSLGLLSDKGINKLLNKLGVDKDGVIDEELFYKTLQDEATKAGMPETVLEYLRKVDNKGNHIPIDLLPDRKWIYQRLISLVNKHGIDLKLPGNQLIQQSGFASGNLDSTFKDKSNNLRFLFNDNGEIKGVEAAVSVQLFKSVIPNYKNKSYQEKVDWLNANEGVLEGLGYRIPTQGQNSTVPITVAQFLPENIGDVIVLPNEFTALTGSDFDIDKLFFVRYNYTTDETGKANKVNISTGTTEEAVQSRYLNYIQEVIDDSPRFTKDEEIALRHLYAEKFRFRTRKADLFGEEGTLYKVYLDRFNNLYSAINSALKANDPDSAAQWLTEYIEVKSKLTDFDFYKDSLTEIYEDINLIKNNIELIKETLKDNEVLPTIDDFRTWGIEKQQTRKALQNHLLDNYRGILLSEHNFTYASTPLGITTNKLKTLSSIITPIEETKPLWQLGAVAQARIKYKYSGGKGGTGPESLNNVHHIMCQVAGVSFNYNIGLGKVDEDGNTSLHDIDSLPEEDGQIIAISDWLSALIDAHVDIAKDPYIINLNVVSDTYDVANLLVRIGMGSKTFQFLPQPILKELVHELDSEKGEIKVSSVTKPIDKIREKYEKLAGKTKVESGYNPFNDDLVGLITMDKSERNEMWYAKQLAILNLFDTLDKGAGKQLNGLVMSSRVDTKKYATDLISNELYIQAMKDMYKEDNFTNLDKLLGFDPETELSTQSDYSTFLGTYYNNGPAMLRRLFGNKSITGTKSFQTALYRIGNLAGITKFTKDRKGKLNRIGDEIYSALMGKFFTEEIGLTEDDVKTIMTSVPAFVRDIKTKHPELSDNVLMESLVKGLETVDDLTFTGIPSIKSDDNREDYMYAWKELLQSNNKDVVSFAKRLYVYSYFTSGYKQGLFSLFQYVPAELHVKFRMNEQEVSFKDYTTKLLDTMNNEEQGAIELLGMSDTIFKNNWMNTMFTPKVYERAISSPITVGKDKDKQTIVSTIFTRKKNSKTSKWDVNVKQVGENSMGDPIYQPYILYQIDKDMSMLLEYIGYINDKWRTPVYKTVHKLGYNNKGRRIVEYGFTKSIIKRNNSIKTLDDDKIMKLMKDMSSYSDFVYIPIENRGIVEKPVIDSPQVNTTEKTYTVTEELKTYSGPINSLKSNQIFVFGSNTEGRHGKGAALTAKQKFGAIYGQSEGLQGQSFAIITKDLTKTVHPSRSEDQIKEQISKLYEFAKQNPTKELMVAYSGEGTNLNAYTPQEMANIFGLFSIPNNVIFEEKFAKLIPNTTEDRSLNVGAENSLESSPITQEQLDPINDKLEVPITMDEWNNMTKDEQDNLLNCL